MFDEEQLDGDVPAEETSVQVDDDVPAEEASAQLNEGESRLPGTVVVEKDGLLQKVGGTVVKVGGAVGQAAAGAAGAVGGVAKKAGGGIKSAAQGAGEVASSAVGAVRERVGRGTVDDEGADAIVEEAATITVEQTEDTAEFATNFLRAVLGINGVHIDRVHFLETELRKQGIPEEQIERAVASRPAAAGIPKAVVDCVAKDAINFETRIASGTSFVTGLPGGAALAATIPVDLAQYYAHIFRLIQKLAYIYGWQSFLDDCGEADDETLYELLVFLGVALGVQNAGGTLVHFAVSTAQPAIAKRIAAQTLTKTAWYNPLKAVLRAVGVSLTKTSFARTASKLVPLVGGFACGGITFAGLKVAGKRLAKHLVTLPQADPNMEMRAQEIVVEIPVVDDADDAAFDMDDAEIDADDADVEEL